MSARDDAIGLLARREHSQFELKRKLIVKGYSSLEVDTLLVSLAKDGLQSDERFAEVYVHHRVGMGFGPRRIEFELSQRGISQALIQQYVPCDKAFWREVLSSVWRRKYHTDHPVNEKAYAKQARFLMQRGFEPEQIYQCLRESRCQSE